LATARRNSAMASITFLAASRTAGSISRDDTGSSARVARAEPRFVAAFIRRTAPESIFEQGRCRR
jgi:hypothetical protein